MVGIAHLRFSQIGLAFNAYVTQALEAVRRPMRLPSSLSDLNVKPLISLGFMFLTRKIKLNDINMLSVTRTSSPTGC